MRKLALALLLCCLCTGCTFVGTVRVSASLDPSSPPATPANEAVAKFADWLVAKGLHKDNAASFGANGRYDFHTVQGTSMLGINREDEYMSVYAGDADTIIVEVTRISDSAPAKFSDTYIEQLRALTEKYLLTATGNTYKVVVVQRL